jgi:hypothetical protein
MEDHGPRRHTIIDMDGHIVGTARVEALHFQDPVGPWVPAKLTVLDCTPSVILANIQFALRCSEGCSPQCVTLAALPAGDDPSLPVAVYVLMRGEGAEYPRFCSTTDECRLYHSPAAPIWDRA